MPSLLFITSNSNKAAEVSAILQSEITSQSCDVPEIQFFSLEEIVKYKVEYAFKKFGRPERKNFISHRRKAWEAMRDLLLEKHLL